MFFGSNRFVCRRSVKFFRVGAALLAYSFLLHFCGLVVFWGTDGRHDGREMFSDAMPRQLGSADGQNT